MILTLIDDSLFICVSSSSLTCEIPISLCCFLLYKKPSFFFSFQHCSGWMGGWDGTDGRSYLVGVRAFIFIFHTFIFVPTSTTPSSLVFANLCKERGGGILFSLIKLQFLLFLCSIFT